jgi:hypothetical protein
LDPTSWGPAVYKIVDASAGVQVLRTRAAYRIALGEPAPGLHPGDLLSLTARFPVAPPISVLVDGEPVTPERVEQIDGPGGAPWSLVRGIRRVVTERDLPRVERASPAADSAPLGDSGVDPGIDAGIDGAIVVTLEAIGSHGACRLHHTVPVRPR